MSDRQICGECKWHTYEEIDRGYVCTLRTSFARTEKGKTMSKYYKAEDVIRAIAEQLCWIARTEYGDKFTTEDLLEEAEDYVSDLPTIEVSEDCISRAKAIEAVKDHSFSLNDDYFEVNGYATIEELEGLPSVLPTVRKNRTTTEQSSMVGECFSDIERKEYEELKKRFHDFVADMRGNDNVETD